MPNTSVGGIRNDLSETLPELQDAESQLYAYATGVLGIDYRIANYGAFRNDADTAQILQYRQDDYDAAVRANPALSHTSINTWRPIAPFGSSFHDYGAAFDVLIINRGSFPTAASALQALKAAASSFGLSSNVPNDPPHFELPISIDEARQRWIDYTTGSNGDGTVNVRVTGAADAAGIITVALLGLVLVAMRYFRR